MSKQQGKEYMNTKHALEVIKKIGTKPTSLTTLISWINVYGIGKKVGGRWWVNKAKLIDMLNKGNQKGNQNGGTNTKA